MRYYMNRINKTLYPCPMGRDKAEKDLAEQGNSAVLVDDLPIITHEQHLLLYPDYTPLVIRVFASVPMEATRHKIKLLTPLEIQVRELRKVF